MALIFIRRLFSVEKVQHVQHSPSVSLSITGMSKYYGVSKTDITTSITLTLLFRSVGAAIFGIAGTFSFPFPKGYLSGSRRLLGSVCTNLNKTASSF